MITKAHVVDAYLLGDLLPCFDDTDRETVAKYILNGDLAFTLNVEDKPIAIFGASGTATENCLGIWTLLSLEVKKKPLLVHRTMKKLCKEVITTLKVDRLQTLVDVDNEVAIKQNEVIGFIREGIVRKIGRRGQDQVLFSIVRGDISYGC
jgi:hypothetical protein